MAELQTHFEIVAKQYIQTMDAAEAIARYLHHETTMPFEVREVAE